MDEQLCGVNGGAEPGRGLAESVICEGISQVSGRAAFTGHA